MSLAIVKNRFTYVIQYMSTDKFGTGTSSSDPVNHLNSMNSDGSWSDLDYNGNPHHAIGRIRAILKAYLDSRRSLYRNTTVKSKVTLALNYWIAHPKQNPNNWWYRWGDIPIRLTSCLFQMRTGDQWGFTDAELSKFADGLSYHHEVESTGRTNLIDGVNTEVFIYGGISKALLKNDVAMFEKELNNMKFMQEYKQTLEHGVHTDYSYHHHRGIFYWQGGYGGMHQNHVSTIIYITHTTKYQFDKRILDIFINSLIYGYGMTQHNGIPDPNSRHRNYMGGSYNTVKYRDNYLLLIDCGYRLNELQSLLDSFYEKKPYQFEGSHAFYTSNILAHKQNGWHMSVNCPTRRNLRVTEVFDESNSKPARFWGGVTTMVDGREMFDAAAVQLGCRNSGITFHHLSREKMWELAYSTPNVVFTQNAFGGVCSTGKLGIAVYHHDLYNVSAKKFYFMTPNGMFALGCDINADKSIYSEDIVTGVEQKAISGDAIMKRKLGESKITSEVNHSDIEWIWQSNVGYIFPTPQNVHTSNVTVNGNYRWENSDLSSKAVTSNVFSSWINHKNPVTNGTYQFIIAPGLSLNETRNFNNPFVVIKNDNTVQCIRYGNDTYGMCFHTAGVVTLENGINISVVGPGLYIFEFNSDRSKVDIYVSDPIGIADMKCEISMQLKGSEYIKHSNPKSTLLEFKANAGGEIGKALTINLTK